LSISGLGDGSKILYVWAKDAAGVTSSVAATAIVLDMTPPVIDISATQPAYSSGTLTFDLSSAETSGVQSINLWVGTGLKADAGTVYSITTTPADETTASTTITASLTNAEQTAVAGSAFRFTVVDAAGNETANGYEITSGGAFGGSATKSLRPGIVSSLIQSMVGSGNTSSSHVSSSRGIFQDITYSTRSTAALTSLAASDIQAAAAAGGASIKPIEVSYIQPVNSRATAIDSSSMSLLGRSRLAAIRSSLAASSIPVQNVRYTESGRQGPATPASESAQSEESSTNTDSSMNVRSTTTTAASEAASPVGTQARAEIPGASGQGTSQAVPRAPSQAPMPRVDLYVKQTQNKEEDDEETSDDL
jgi:hypothetical protein